MLYCEICHLELPWVAHSVAPCGGGLLVAYDLKVTYKYASINHSERYKPCFIAEADMDNVEEKKGTVN